MTKKQKQEHEFWYNRFLNTLPPDVKTGYIFTCRIKDPNYYATSTLKKFCALLAWLEENRQKITKGTIWFNGKGFHIEINNKIIEIITFKGAKFQERIILKNEQV